MGPSFCRCFTPGSCQPPAASRTASASPPLRSRTVSRTPRAPFTPARPRSPSPRRRDRVRLARCPDRGRARPGAFLSRRATFPGPWFGALKPGAPVSHGPRRVGAGLGIRARLRVRRAGIRRTEERGPPIWGVPEDDVRVPRGLRLAAGAQGLSCRACRPRPPASGGRAEAAGPAPGPGPARGERLRRVAPVPGAHVVRSGAAAGPAPLPPVADGRWTQRHEFRPGAGPGSLWRETSRSNRCCSRGCHAPRRPPPAAGGRGRPREVRCGGCGCAAACRKATTRSAHASAVSPGGARDGRRAGRRAA